jgi:hypothetical protein
MLIALGMAVLSQQVLWPVLPMLNQSVVMRIATP